MGTVIEQPRNARSRRTAEALLSAARQVLETQGFEAMTMATVAERAGVTRRSVYLHYASRAELVAALFEYVNQAEGLADSQAAVWAAPDAVTALAEWAAHIARYMPRILSVARAVEQVHRVDPDAGSQRARAMRSRHGACRRLMTRLADEGRLADTWTVDEAADMLMALTSLDFVETLLVDRRWSRRRFVEHYQTLLYATFVADPAGQKPQTSHGR
jgi:AcrR family transcriptional regulator